jgi:paired amphipathic helix protein Sin3a
LQDVEQYKRNRDGQQQDEETKTETQEPQEQTLQTTSRPPDFNQAINYVTKIKKRFENDPVVYKSFLDILHNYQRQQTTVQHVYDQFAVLFKDHADLLAEFAYFLPSK